MTIPKEKIPIKMHSRGWDLIVNAAIGNSLLRVSGELITNSVDSYDRLVKGGLLNRDNEKPIKINYIPGSDNGFYFITDQAEGMDAKTLEKCTTEYGAETSGEAARGIFGFGLKDTCLAMKHSKIFSIKDGKISECEIKREDGQPYVTFLRKDENVSKTERQKSGIKENGTCVQLLIPSNFTQPDFEEFYQKLRDFYMLRKINETKDIKIQLSHGLEDTGHYRRIVYTKPLGKLLLEKTVPMRYRSNNLKIKMTIMEADRELLQRGELREGGLLIFYDNYAVIECSLFGYDGHPFASKLFGEIDIECLRDVIKNDPSILDPKRKAGFDKTHPFYEGLEKLVLEDLRKIIDELAKKAIKGGEDFDLQNKRETLKEINKIARAEIETTEIAPPAEIPVDYITFYYRNKNLVELKEEEEQGIFLLINSKKVPDKAVIYIGSNNPNVKVTPQIISVSHSKSKEGRINERIIVLGKKAGSKAELIAKYKDKTAKINVFVNENPRLHPKDGFEFIPDKITITINERERASLLIDKELAKQYGAIILESSNPNIYCEEKIILTNLNKYQISKTYEILDIPISLLGTKLKERGTITAKCGNKITKLITEVVTPIEKQTRGLFKDLDIQDLPDIQDISVDRDGYLIVNSAHPVVSKYKKDKDYRFNKDYRTMVIDVFTQRICKSIIERKQKDQKLPILDPTSPESVSDAINREFIRLYFEHGEPLHKILSKFLEKTWTSAM